MLQYQPLIEWGDGDDEHAARTAEAADPAGDP